MSDHDATNRGDEAVHGDQTPHDDGTDEGRAPDVFALSRTDLVILGAICVGAGVALGFFLPVIGSFAARFPIPLGDVVEKLSAFDQPWVVIARPIIGAILGVIATLVFAHASPRLSVGDDVIIVDKHNDHPVRISRSSFASAYFDDGQLTILTSGGQQAFRGSVEGKKGRIAEAFTSRGYRWGEI